MTLPYSRRGSMDTGSLLTIAVAPVFLISGIGMLLNIMSLRYGRVIDRTRFLLREGDRVFKREMSGDHLNYELRILYGRARRLRLTVMCGSAAIFCVSMTIFFLFTEKLFSWNLPGVAPAFFLMALVCLVISLLLLMKDFHQSMILIRHDLQVRAPEVASELPAES